MLAEDTGEGNPTSNFTIGQFKYSVLSEEDKTVEYIGSTIPNKEITGAITIPETVQYNNVTYSVISTKNKAFYKCKGLTSIEISKSLYFN